MQNYNTVRIIIHLFFKHKNAFCFYIHWQDWKKVKENKITTFLLSLGYTPALACAPNKDVADCLALILATMMPVSSSSQIPSLTFNSINHYTTSSKTVTFDSSPITRSEHSSYCSFNNIGREDGYPYTEEDELNDSDSETY